MEAECDQGPDGLIRIWFDNLQADAAPMIR